jgi:uncharacterized membrane protein YtjA (UPF0391 family)
MYPLMFLMVGLMAGALNLTGLAAVASQMSWILIGMVIHAFLGHLAQGRPE